MEQSSTQPKGQSPARPAEPQPYFSPAGRALLCRLVFTGILVSLVYSFFSHTLLHQLCRPALRYVYVDPAYWAMELSGIPAFITGHPVVAMLFDGSLFVTCALTLIAPRQRIFIVLFFVLNGIYFITFNLYGGLHTGSKIGTLLAPIPFIASGAVAFTMLWDGLRYFTLFVYADAFIWKLLRGTWLHNSQGTLIIRKNLAAYLYFHPDTLQAKLYYWILLHPWWTDILFKTGFILEGLFIIGFFTRRFDRYLLIASLLLPLGFLFISDAFFFGLYILSLTLLNWQAIFRRPYFAGFLQLPSL